MSSVARRSTPPTPLILEPVTTFEAVSTATENVGEPHANNVNNKDATTTTEWSVCQRLVSPHPALTSSKEGTRVGRATSRGACIETVWQVSSSSFASATSRNHHSSHRWARCRQRIAVYSGPSSNLKTLHVSLELPESAVPPSLLDGSNDNGNSNTTTGSNCLAWVNFPEQRFPVLCCLIHPNALCLWEIYPDDDNTTTTTTTSSPFMPLPSEGWTIPLPFECATIAALPSMGLLLQRVPDYTSEDSHHRGVVVTMATPSSSLVFKHDNGGSGGWDHPDDFVLQGPPVSWRQKQHQQRLHHQHTSTPSAAVAAATVAAVTTTPSVFHTANLASPTWQSATTTTTMPSSSLISSMFTLHHPLEDVVPVTQAMDSSATTTGATFSALVTDPLEQVVWVGETEWLDDTTVSSSDPSLCTAHLLVTYHTVQQRHAVWRISDAPAPPPLPPLHQQTRHRSAAIPYPTNSRNPHNNVLNRTATTMHAQSDHPETSRATLESSNHWDTLWEDASPTLDLQLPFSSASTGVAATLARRAGPEDGGTDIDTAVAPLDSSTPAFLSGRVARDQALADALGVHRRAASPRKSLGAAGATSASSTVVVGGSSGGRRRSVRNVEHVSVMNRSFMSPSAAAIANAATGVDMGPATTHAPTTRFSTCLYPKVSLTCLYCEESGTAKTKSDTVFLASNHEATGLLTLAMFTATARTLSIFSLKPTTVGVNSNRLDVRVKSVNTIICLAAVPVSAFPTPLRCVAGQKRLLSPWITDIMILQENNELSLFRGDTRSIPCATATSNYTDGTVVLTNIVDPIANCFNLEMRNKTTGKCSSARYKLNASLQGESEIAERILSVIDASLYSVKSFPFCEIAMNVRMDCCRLRQSLQSRSMPRQPEGATNLTIVSLQTVLFSLLKFEIMGDERHASLLHRESTSPAKNPWQILLQSDFHCSFMTHNSSIFTVNCESERKAAPSYDILLEDGSLTINALAKSTGNRYVLRRVFDALHFLYEDLKLTTFSCGGESLQVASLLVGLAQLVQMAETRFAVTTNLFLDYYRQDIGETLFQSTVRSTLTNCNWGTTRNTASNDFNFNFTSFVAPPSILAWIEAALASSVCNGGVNNIKYPSEINSACLTTRSIVRIFSLMQSELGPTRDAMLTLVMLEEGFTDAMSLQSRLRLGVALPLLEVLFRCRKQASSIDVAGWSPEAWRLVGRDDLSMNMTSQRSKIKTISNDDMHKTTGSIALPENAQLIDDAARDGLVTLERRAAVLFPEDNRVHEAARLLSSSRPIFLRVARAVEVSDHDFERLKQKQLQRLSYRSLSLPTGRGMLTIGSLRLVPAEPLPLPDLCLKGRVPPTNATLNLDISDCAADMLVWPEFHNGVAAGLRLPTDDEIAYLAISRTWISFNKPPATRPTQPQETGGDTNPPSQAHSFSHGGLLFALGLRGHLTSLEMSDVYEYLTQGCATTTVGVLLGLAVNKRGSCDVAISKMLCLHIPSLIPQHFSAIDVASTVQTAAIAAAGLLFQGSSHRMMTEFLLNEIGKRPETDVNTCDREAYTLACGLALGTVNLCLGARMSGSDRAAGLADLRIEERLIRYIVGGVDGAEVDRTRESNDRFSVPNSASGNDSERCSTIFESNLINTSVTAPGATLALGLLYMKTNNSTVASALALPETHFLLEFVRADFLGLRVISRALILWDEVLPTDEWIDNQVPRVIRTAYQHMGDVAKSTFGIRSPASHKHAPLDVEYDRRAVRQIYVHVASAACFGLGLRFAGTGNPDAKSAVMKRVLQMHSLREASDPVSVACRPEMSVLETCLGCSAISLAMIMAGTGDLDALRVFKILRWRCDSESQYGIHMIYGMAIGLLFLGGGTCTLGTEPADIAALITAFFPRFPMSTSDNQYHLQALRHLYAIAVKRKELCAIDVDTRENVHLTVEVTRGAMANPLEFKLPCLLLNTEIPYQKLRVRSDKYYPLELDISLLKGSHHFYVKRHYSPSSVKDSILVQRSSNRPRTGNSLPNMMQSSMSDNFLKAFTEHFCGLFGKTSCLSDSDFLYRCVRECSTEDTEETLGVYLSIHNGIRMIKNNRVGAAAWFVWDQRLLRTYYRYQREQNHVLSAFDTDLLLPYLQEAADRVLE